MNPCSAFLCLVRATLVLWRISIIFIFIPYQFPGPGPGAYQLPTTCGFNQHDPSRYRNPMYSFGTNAGFRVKGLGPGPAYRIDRVTRDGVVSSPAWSFGAR